MKSRYLFEPPSEIPFDKLQYKLTPLLVSNLTWAHRNGGKLSAMRFSHYGYKRLENKALTRRIAHMVCRAGNNVGFDEVKNVLAGNLLPPRRQAAQMIIRRVAVIQEGVRQFARSGDVSTPEIFHTYLNFINSGDPLWSRFVGAKKEKMLEIQRGSVSVSRDVAKLYEWINADELIEHEPILRAATLYWGLFCLHHSGTAKPALEATVDHELRAGSIDNHGLLVLPDTEPGFEVLNHYDIFSIKAYETGDLTDYFEIFAGNLARALNHLAQSLLNFQDNEDRLPWLMVRPPDELDRHIFDIIERFGSAKAQDILKELKDPPPIRTLQRRLQQLCKDGLIAKHGSRKFAFYRLAEHF